MSSYPRMKVVALYVGAAIAQLAAMGVRADSGIGVDTVLGNALNPNTVSSAQRKDPEELSEIPNSRTPTGFLEEEPNLIPEPNKTAGGTVYNASIEAGGLKVGGDKDAAKFREYKDLKSGGYLNNFQINTENPDRASFVEILGGGVGNDDQFYGASTGRYNDWKLKLFYDETPHVFTSTYRNIYNGTGTDNLTLVPGLTPGGTTSTAVTTTNLTNVVKNTPYSDLELIRKKGGLRFDKLLGTDWKVYASYSNEKREGARPFGMLMGTFGGAGNVDLPESINYNTHDFATGLQWSNELSSANLQASASLFRNNISTMTFQSPFFVAPGGGVTIPGVASIPQGRYDLYPDNDFYNLKGEYAHLMPSFYNARFTAVGSFSRFYQNDDLLPATMYPGVAVNGVTGGAWDTPASLSKQTADATIDTRLVNLGLALNPTHDLNVRGKVRYYKTDNKTTYWACNPLTGQWGRLLNDGSQTAFATPATTTDNPTGTTVNSYNAGGCNYANTQALNLVPSAGNINIRNIPYDYTQWVDTIDVDYRLNRANSVNGSLERETYDREHRERDKTWEDKIKLGYVNRGLEQGTIRTSIEYDQRRGSEYNPDPYNAFYSASLGPLPTAGTSTTPNNVASWIHNIDQFRKFDLADRDQEIFNGRFNYALAETVDGGISLQVKNADYPDSQFGRSKQDQNTASLDLSWQASTDTSLYGYYSFQDATMKQSGVQPNACAIGTTYSFWSNGVVTAGTVPGPAGATLLGQTMVTSDNWQSVCGQAGALSPLYPTSRGWDVTQKDRNNTVGLGFRYDFHKALLDLNYSYLRGRTSFSYDYNPAALGMTAVTAALAGGGYPDMLFEQHIVEANLLVPVSKRTSVRLLYRYEKAKIRDFHYDGIAANPVPANQQVYLDAGPQDYSVNVVGLLLRVTL